MGALLSGKTQKRRSRPESDQDERPMNQAILLLLLACLICAIFAVLGK
jgi:hypothetical protein